VPTLTIVAHGDSAAVVLPPSVLDLAGLRIGEVLEATLGDRQLILRPVEDIARRQKLQEIARDVFEQRRVAYQRLA
jgi:antitoxin component of MazEF toxin-antitoxin module